MDSILIVDPILIVESIPLEEPNPKRETIPSVPIPILLDFLEVCIGFTLDTSCKWNLIRGVIIPIFFGIGIGITFTSRKSNRIGIGTDGIVSLFGFGSSSGIDSTIRIGSTIRIESTTLISSTDALESI